MTNQTGSPGARASAKLARAVNPEDVYWQENIITDKKVALEDHGSDNIAKLTRGTDLVVQSAQSLAAEIPVCMCRVQNYGGPFLSSSTCSVARQFMLERIQKKNLNMLFTSSGIWL